MNQDIAFSEKQTKGIAYEQPVISLLNEIADYEMTFLMAQKGDPDARQEIATSTKTIDTLFDDLAKIDSLYG